jgi:prefoldin subunit 5
MRLKASIEDQIRELEENNEDLRGKLVKSPERLHAEIQDIEQKNADRAQHIQDCETTINQMSQQIHILTNEADRHLGCFKGEFDMIRNDIRTWDKAQRDRNSCLMAIDREKATRAKFESKETSLDQCLENDISDLKSQLQRCRNNINHFHGLTAQHNE